MLQQVTLVCCCIALAVAADSDSRRRLLYSKQYLRRSIQEQHNARLVLDMNVWQDNTAWRRQVLQDAPSTASTPTDATNTSTTATSGNTTSTASSNNDTMAVTATSVGTLPGLALTMAPGTTDGNSAPGALPPPTAVLPDASPPISSPPLVPAASTIAPPATPTATPHPSSQLAQPPPLMPPRPPAPPPPPWPPPRPDLPPISAPKKDELMDEHPELEGCPDWLFQYIQWHAEAKHKPDTKYLLFTCIKPFHHCPGLGDRLRGMAYALKVAVHFSRVLLIKWTLPGELELFLVPNAINWTLMHDPDMEARLQPGGNFYQTVNGHPDDPYQDWARVNYTKGSPMYPPDYHSDDKVLAISTNWFDNSNYLPGPTLSRYGYETSCVYRALFKPSDALNAKVAETQERLHLQPGKYVAAHLRMGQQRGESIIIADRSFDRFESVLSVVDCAQDMLFTANIQEAKQRSGLSVNSTAGNTTLTGHAQHNDTGHAAVIEGSMGESTGRRTRETGNHSLAQVDMLTRRRMRMARLHRMYAASHNNRDLLNDSRVVDERPALLLTDNVALRRMAARKQLVGVVGPGYEAHHIAQSHVGSVDDMYNVFVDFVLMVQARCLIASMSGYSDGARLWGWHQCHTTIYECIKRHYKKHLPDA